MWLLQMVKTGSVNFSVMKKHDNRDSCLIQKLTTREADFNQFMRLRNHLVIAAENFGREENLSPVLVTLMSKDMVEQFKLAQKVVAVDRPYIKIFVTLLRYNVAKPQSSYAYVLFLSGTRGSRSFHNMSLSTINLKNLFIHLM